MPTATDTTLQPASVAQIQLLQFAEAARIASAGKPYKFGGSSPDGFDCSGFVAYVFNKAFGAGNPPRLTAEDLRNSSFFGSFTGDPQPGDLIFFTTDGSTASHVAIVVSADRWIGSQSSTGVAYVHTSNPYWKPKILCYRRHVALAALSSALPLWGGSYVSAIASV